MGKKHKLSSKPYKALKKEKNLLGRATTGPCFLIENWKLTKKDSSLIKQIKYHIFLHVP